MYVLIVTKFPFLGLYHAHHLGEKSLEIIDSIYADDWETSTRVEGGMRQSDNGSGTGWYEEQFIINNS